MSSRLLVELSEDFPLSSMRAFTVFPLFRGENPMQHYNSILSLSYMQEYCDSIVGKIEIVLHFEPVVCGQSIHERQASDFSKHQ